MLEHAEPITYVLIAAGSVVVTLVAQWSRGEGTFRRDLLERIKGLSKALAQCQDRCDRLQQQNTELRLDNGRLEMENETLRAEVTALKTDQE
ncbi:hypothetical protein [Natronospira bacteriovora]|uniref:Uncharacterized protein n=1 Tax=Natronospira bacteriovora TaxID=3069753 RepID=A0ABU0W5L3_9GAMM|nr:hypothetical protein [Natronospira sp. AB-CW4]MDQ2069307.1 hypothetical protein [Natronospira sp. AB-CW4]